MARKETYTIHLDGMWSLEDLYRFPRTYEQVYFFVNALEIVEENYSGEEVDHLFKAFPWRGGYSTVGFYNNLKYQTKVSRRPKIVSIQYASPGWLEIGLILSAALNVEKIVKIVSSSVETIDATYSSIRKGMHERKLTDIRVEREQLKLDAESIKFIKTSSKTMADMIGID